MLIRLVPFLVSGMSVTINPILLQRCLNIILSLETQSRPQQPLVTISITVVGCTGDISRLFASLNWCSPSNLNKILHLPHWLTCCLCSWLLPFYYLWNFTNLYFTFSYWVDNNARLRWTGHKIFILFEYAMFTFLN